MFCCKTPKQARSEETKETLRAAALEVFSEQGFHGTTLDAVAKRAGVSKGAIYWHYPSKQALFADLGALWEQGIETMLAEIEASQPDPIELLHRVRALMVGQLFDNLTLIKASFAFYAQAANDAELRTLCHAQISTWQKRLSTWYRAALGAEIPEATLATLVDLTMLPFDGAVLRATWACDLSPERIDQAFLQLLTPYLPSETPEAGATP